MGDGIILHCMQAEKFIEPFIDFVEEYFYSSRHLFLIRESNKYHSKHRSNVILIKERGSRLIQLVLYSRHLNRAEKIILHGLFDRTILLILFMQPWLLKKCYWVMWGGDLYYYQNRPRSFRSDLFEKIRVSVIGRIGHFVTYIKGDYELAKKWYGVQGEYHECLMYPSNLYKDYVVPPKQGDSINILVGNSADPTNNHAEIFEKLKPYKNQNIRIVCPLSYGQADYVEQIVKLGTELFGNKFVPLLEFMPFEKYIELLGQVDIAVFAHKRQQAMGNTITLLGLGKKVFMRDDTTSWAAITQMGIRIYNLRSFELNNQDETSKEINKEIVRNFFSESNLRNQLNEIFR